MTLAEVLELDNLLSIVSSSLLVNLQKSPTTKWCCHLTSKTGRLVIGIGEDESIYQAVVLALAAFDTNKSAPVTYLSSGKSSGRNLEKISLKDLL